MSGVSSRVGSGSLYQQQQHHQQQHHAELRRGNSAPEVASSLRRTEGPPDSGREVLPVGELELPLSMEELCEATMARVVKQVHFYFGDRNYPTDKFLRKNARRTKEGWIPLSVVAIYKKMKKITDDQAIMADALQDSEVVELSPDRASIRRRHPPPKDDPEAVCSAMVVVDNFTGDAMGLAHLLSPAGHIVRTHHVRPNTPLPSEIFEVFQDRSLPGSLAVRQAECWLVEFDYADEALLASRELPTQPG